MSEINGRIDSLQCIVLMSGAEEVPSLAGPRPTTRHVGEHEMCAARRRRRARYYCFAVAQ
jgi:hypothetical protein